MLNIIGKCLQATLALYKQIDQDSHNVGTMIESQISSVSNLGQGVAQ
jgi:hypothetical protein